MKKRTPPTRKQKQAPAVYVPNGMSGKELHDIKLFDDELYEHLKKVKFRAI